MMWKMINFYDSAHKWVFSSALKYIKIPLTKFDGHNEYEHFGLQTFLVWEVRQS